MRRGVSLIVLVITITIIVTLTGVVVINSNRAVGNTAITQLQLDIAQLENLMNTYKIRKNGNIGFEIVQFNTANLTQSQLEQFQGEVIRNNVIELYVIDLYEIDANAVNYGNLKSGANDRYVYSLNTGKVYYEKGLVMDDVVYYYVGDTK